MRIKQTEETSKMFGPCFKKVAKQLLLAPIELEYLIDSSPRVALQLLKNRQENN